MKKGFVLKFVPLVLIIILVGIVILLVFLGNDGHLTNIASKVPEFLNTVLGEIEKRSPASNSIYYFSNIVGVYTYAKDSTIDYSCFYLLDNSDRRMEEGYVNINQSGDKVSVSLKTNEINEETLSPMEIEGKACIVSGALANEITRELNRQNNARVYSNRFLRFFSNSDVGRLDFNSNPFYVNYNISISSKGADQIRFNEHGYDVSEYLLYKNNEICFIPISRDTTNRCEVRRDGTISSACISKMRKFKC
jgi:hypothetical protein